MTNLAIIITSVIVIEGVLMISKYGLLQSAQFVKDTIDIIFGEKRLTDDGKVVRK